MECIVGRHSLNYLWTRLGLEKEKFQHAFAMIPPFMAVVTTYHKFVLTCRLATDTPQTIGIVIIIHHFSKHKIHKCAVAAHCPNLKQHPHASTINNAGVDPNLPPGTSK